LNKNIMILNEFSKYLQANNELIISEKKSALKLLCEWINSVMLRNPKTNVDKIIHTEITLAKNNQGDFFITGKSDSGRVLVKALYNFALSYEQYVMQKWLEDKKPDDFNFDKI